MIGVSDAIISDNFNIQERQNYSTEEKLNLILEKLYILYDDYYYPIKDIMIGNRIVFKRSTDDYDLAKLLERDGFIQMRSAMGIPTIAQLTAAGAKYVEENRKPIKADYSKINKNSEELNTKIDEIIEQLKKHGDGQEILFDELQELKELYTILNNKTWGQVVKGKLMDLALGKLVENDTLKYIYKELTNQALQLF